MSDFIWIKIRSCYIHPSCNCLPWSGSCRGSGVTMTHRVLGLPAHSGWDQSPNLPSYNTVCCTVQFASNCSNQKQHSGSVDRVMTPQDWGLVLGLQVSAPNPQTTEVVSKFIGIHNCASMSARLQKTGSKVFNQFEKGLYHYVYGCFPAEEGHPRRWRHSATRLLRQQQII